MGHGRCGRRAVGDTIGSIPDGCRRVTWFVGRACRCNLREIQVGRACRVSGGSHSCWLWRRKRAQWEVQGRGCRAAGERGTANTRMAPLAAEARAEAALERGVAGAGGRERPDPTPNIDDRTADIRAVRTTGGPYNKWRDDDKLANLVVGVFDTAADAHVSFVASNELSRAYGAKYGFVVKAEKCRRARRRGMASLGAQQRQRSDVPLAARQPRDRGACPLLRRLPARRGCRTWTRRLERGQTRSTKKRAPQAARSSPCFKGGSRHVFRVRDG